MRGLALIFCALVAVSAHPRSARITGGSLTTIYQYPEMASLLFSETPFGHRQSCGGIIINNRSILTAAHCTYGRAPFMWRSRLGSTFANSGGMVYNTAYIINHPLYNITSFLDHDVSVIRVQGSIIFGHAVRNAQLAGPEYFVADNQVVWLAGWGRQTRFGPPSEQLQHVQVYTINQQICRDRYRVASVEITGNMICTGILDVGGRDHCNQDSGGPVYHNGVVVGVISFGFCGIHPFYPGVSARVQPLAEWINQNR